MEDFFSLKAAILKVWVATQTWVAKDRKMSGAMVIQICHKNFFRFIFQVVSIPS